MKLRDVGFLVEVGFCPSRARAYQLIREGRVPGAVVQGGTVRIVEEVFLAAIQAQAVKSLDAIRWRDSDASASQ